MDDWLEHIQWLDGQNQMHMRHLSGWFIVLSIHMRVMWFIGSKLVGTKNHGKGCAGWTVSAGPITLSHDVKSLWTADYEDVNVDRWIDKIGQMSTQQRQWAKWECFWFCRGSNIHVQYGGIGWVLCCPCQCFGHHSREFAILRVSNNWVRCVYCLWSYEERSWHACWWNCGYYWNWWCRI